MNITLKTITERKKKINNLCSDLRWIFRGYYTSLYDFLPMDDNLDEIQQLCDQLISYDEEISDGQKNLYRLFLVSATLFLKNYCLPSDMIFYSIYKIAGAVEDCVDQKMEFCRSTYWYMYEPHMHEEKHTIFDHALSKTLTELGDLFDNKEIDKSDFSYHISVMLDMFLFEKKRSCLLDENYEGSIRRLANIVGSAKFQWRQSVKEIKDDGK